MHLFASVISELIYRINQKPADEERFMVAIGYADDILIMVTPGREKDAIRIAMAEYERLKLEVNTNKTSSNDKTLFENNSGIVTYLGQEFGQDAKPLTDQILANVQERIGSLFDLDISLHNRQHIIRKMYPNMCKLWTTCRCMRRYARISRNISKQTMSQLKASGKLQKRAQRRTNAVCSIPQMQRWSSLNIPRTTLQPHEIRPVRERTTHKRTRRRRFVKEKEDLIPTQCPNCGGKNSSYHETNCKKAQEYHIGVHDKIVDHIEQVLRQYKAVKVSKENHNRLYDGIKPDIAINYRGERIYLDVGITWYKEKYYKAKVKHYQGYEAKIIPIIVGKNCTLHKESHHNCFQRN
ncbi:Hypothetical_protein [Hexamita inflata]|uniref:Hypothetical_protein n=1 Tax=Hexamita inflata TaxID=28002 RepID=A0ABP1LMV1_9EUKA